MTIYNRNLFILFISLAATIAIGCSHQIEQGGFRVRSDFKAGLNSNQGWAGSLNENVTVYADQPFRIRFEMAGSDEQVQDRQFTLQYRRNDGDWTNVDAGEFPKPEEASSRVSIIDCNAYENGEKTTQLLSSSNGNFIAGSGINLANKTKPWQGGAARGEWEWPLVIRRFSDGAQTNNEGDIFEFRMAGLTGNLSESNQYPALTLSILAGHIGGTFVETPGRIGPFQASNGDLYFIIEPAETDNALLMVKSSDNGQTWQEVDGENRPSQGDLEGFAAFFWKGTIHMLHQKTRITLHHSFHTSDHSTHPDTWDIRDERIASHDGPPTQVATLAVRSDGSMVAVYGSTHNLHYKIRSADGIWEDREGIIDAGNGIILSDPQVIPGVDDDIHLAYYGSNGTAWHRHILPDGSLTSAVLLSEDLSPDPLGENGSILPLVFIPETNTLVAIYQDKSGMLWERRVTDSAISGLPVQVSGRKVVHNAIDSDQAGADAIAHGTAVHILFIEDETGSIYHTYTNDSDTWQPSELLVDGIKGQWIRGSLLTNQDGEPVYGFVYDAGSNGGSGMNKYEKIPLDSTLTTL